MISLCGPMSTARTTLIEHSTASQSHNPSNPQMCRMYPTLRISSKLWPPSPRHRCCCYLSEAPILTVGYRPSNLRFNRHRTEIFENVIQHQTKMETCPYGSPNTVLLKMSILSPSLGLLAQPANWLRGTILRAQPNSSRRCEPTPYYSSSKPYENFHYAPGTRHG